MSPRRRHRLVFRVRSPSASTSRKRSNCCRVSSGSRRRCVGSGSEGRSSCACSPAITTDVSPTRSMTNGTIASTSCGWAGPRGCRRATCERATTHGMPESGATNERSKERDDSRHPDDGTFRGRGFECWLREQLAPRPPPLEDPPARAQFQRSRPRRSRSRVRRSGSCLRRLVPVDDVGVFLARQDVDRRGRAIARADDRLAAPGASRTPGRRRRRRSWSSRSCRSRCRSCRRTSGPAASRASGPCPPRAPGTARSTSRRRSASP